MRTFTHSVGCTRGRLRQKHAGVLVFHKGPRQACRQALSVEARGSLRPRRARGDICRSSAPGASIKRMTRRWSLKTCSLGQAIGARELAGHAAGPHKKGWKECQASCVSMGGRGRARGAQVQKTARDGPRASTKKGSRCRDRVVFHDSLPGRARAQGARGRGCDETNGGGAHDRGSTGLLS